MLSNNLGQSVVEWDTVPNAVYYDVEQEPGLGSDELTRYRVRNTSLTIGGLTPRTIYAIKVRAIGSSTSMTSDWSERIYTYPTHEPIPVISRQLGTYDEISTSGNLDTIRIAGYQQQIYKGYPAAIIGNYIYIICTTTLTPSTNEANIIREITKGAEIWKSATNVVTITKDNSDCTADELIIDKAQRSTANNIIRFADSAETIQACVLGQSTTAPPACVNHFPNPLQSHSGVINITHIFILEDAGTANRTMSRNAIFTNNNISITSNCSYLFQLTMHEVGHAFGLGDLKARGESVMSNSLYDLCDPTALDVVAIRAIYQSR